MKTNPDRQIILRNCMVIYVSLILIRHGFTAHYEENGLPKGNRGKWQTICLDCNLVGTEMLLDRGASARPYSKEDPTLAPEAVAVDRGGAGDANSAFNKVSHGCHLNIVAYSLFSSGPCSGGGRSRVEKEEERREKADGGCHDTGEGEEIFAR
ncbi:hypothetical protein KM043_018025 [Ampulex compressa]|nr:hypothetical protein KM043_018025 [Ampulex compressa]